MRAVALHEEVSAGRLLVLVELVLTLSLRGSYAPAKEHSTTLLRMADELNQPHLTAWALAAGAMAHRDIGDEAAAIKLNHTLVAMLRRAGNGLALALALNLLAWDYLRRSDIGGAKELVDEAMRLVESSGALGERTGGLVHTAGAIALVRGKLDEAAVFFTLGLTVSSSNWDHSAHHIEGLAVVATDAGDPVRALRLLSAAAAMRAGADLHADPWWSQQLEEAEVRARRQLAGLSCPVAEGPPLSTQETIDYALHDQLPASHTPPSSDTVLTAREDQIARLVAEGLTNQQIAARIEVSPRTVASHLERIRAKIDVPTRAQLTAWVLQR